MKNNCFSSGEKLRAFAEVFVYTSVAGAGPVGSVPSKKTPIRNILRPSNSIPESPPIAEKLVPVSGPVLTPPSAPTGAQYGAPELVEQSAVPVILSILTQLAPPRAREITGGRLPLFTPGAEACPAPQMFDVELTPPGMTAADKGAANATASMHRQSDNQSSFLTGTPRTFPESSTLLF
jgi:hypothetical protein